MARVRRPQQPLLNNVLSRLESQLHALHAQQLCKLLWALGTMRHDPGQHFMDATAEQCLRRINDLQPQGITNIMYGYGLTWSYMLVGCMKMCFCACFTLVHTKHLCPPPLTPPPHTGGPLHASTVSNPLSCRPCVTRQPPNVPL